MVIDFGLYHSLKEKSYNVQFFDKYLDRHYLHRQTEEMHFFLNNWYKDKDGNDLFNYNGISFGDSFLLSILTEVSFFSHFFISFIHLKELSYKTLFVALDNDLLSILDKTGLAHQRITHSEDNLKQVYYFPIKLWMGSAISSNSIRSKLKRLMAKVMDHVLLILDFFSKKKNVVFIQEYHPTNAIIHELRKNPNLQVVTTSYSGEANFLNERRVFYGNHKEAIKSGKRLFENAKTSLSHKWMVQDVDLASLLYKMIFRIIEVDVSSACSDIKSIERFFNKRNPVLMIPVTDLWMRNSLIMSYFHKNEIPIYFIINGLLFSSFWREAKKATFINAYSKTIRENYFKSSPKAEVIGDPRMDYYGDIEQRELDLKNPTITIGTSGFSPIDLNSFLAVEFEFIYDVLSVLKSIKDEGHNFEIILKVRPNGYLDQYESLVQEFFSDLDISFYQNESFKTLIAKTDIYISIYSQTLFEALSLGIPSIYYKNENQIMLAPFSEDSQLTIARSKEKLHELILSFYSEGDLIKNRVSREELELLIGPLDGKNLKRNLNFIERII